MLYFIVNSPTNEKLIFIEYSKIAKYVLFLIENSFLNYVSDILALI